MKRNIIALILMCIVITIVIAVPCFYKNKTKMENIMSNKDRLELSNEKYKELFNSYPEPEKETDPELMLILRKSIFKRISSSLKLSTLIICLASSSKSSGLLYIFFV